MGLRDSARYGVLERSDEPQGGFAVGIVFILWSYTQMLTLYS